MNLINLIISLSNKGVEDSKENVLVLVYDKNGRPMLFKPFTVALAATGEIVIECREKRA